MQSPTKCFPVSFPALCEKRICPSPGGVVRKVHRFWSERNLRGTLSRRPVLQKWSQRNDLHLCNKNSIVGKSFCAMKISALEKEKEKIIPPSKFASFGFSNLGQPRTIHFFYLGLIGSTISVSLMVFSTSPLLSDAPHGSSRRLMITLNFFGFCKWVLHIHEFVTGFLVLHFCLTNVPPPGSSTRLMTTLIFIFFVFLWMHVAGVLGMNRNHIHPHKKNLLQKCHHVHWMPSSFLTQTRVGTMLTS